MDNKEHTTVNNNGPTPQNIDLDGLAKVVENAKRTIPATDNGFIPLRDFDPKKPYEAIEAHLKEWQARLDSSPLNPAQRISYLEGEQKRLQEQHEDELEKYRTDRVGDVTTFTGQRITDLENYHKAVVDLKNDEIQKLQKRIGDLEGKNKKLEDQHEADIQQRLTDQAQYHKEIFALTQEVSKARLEWLKVEQARVDDSWTKLEREKDALITERKGLWQEIVNMAKGIKLSKLIK